MLVGLKPMATRLERLEVGTPPTFRMTNRLLRATNHFCARRFVPATLPSYHVSLNLDLHLQHIKRCNDVDPLKSLLPDTFTFPRRHVFPPLAI